MLSVHLLDDDDLQADIHAYENMYAANRNPKFK